MPRIVPMSLPMKKQTVCANVFVCATVRNVSFGGPVGSHIQRIQRVPGERGTFSRDLSFRIQALAFRIQAFAFRIQALPFRIHTLKVTFAYILSIN